MGALKSLQATFKSLPLLLPPSVGGSIDHSRAAESKGSQPQASGKHKKAKPPLLLHWKPAGDRKGKWEVVLSLIR